jgi:[lysine-biosynthesis-protein LysW]--L-2-aminoadipate ligase
MTTPPRSPRVAILHSRIRVEERLICDEFTALGIEHELLDARELVFDIHDGSPWARFDVILDRCISQSGAVAAVRVFERFGIPCVNSARVIEACGDKLTTSLLLAQAGVPTPRTRIALDSATALRAVEENGYPAVLKPTVGSWGRLLARVHDRDAAEAIIEHKATLGSAQHGVFYVQEYVNKPDRDLRVFMVGDTAICGIIRESAHWITNTARGGRAGVFEVDPQTAEICRRAARAICGDTSRPSTAVLAIDLLESPSGGMLVSEINHTMEFRNSIAPTGVNIPRFIAQWTVDQARRGEPATSAAAGTPVVTATGTHAGTATGNPIATSTGTHAANHTSTPTATVTSTATANHTAPLIEPRTQRPIEVLQ